MKKLFLLFLLLWSYSFAFEKVSLGYGGDTNDISIYNIALQKKLGFEIINNTDLNLEISAEYVDGESDDLYIISTQPMVSYNFTEDLYIQAGLGIAYFSEKNLDKKRFGKNFQFKESIGFGYRFNKELESTLKYTHYSNADLYNENAGLDLITLQFIYKF